MNDETEKIRQVAIKGFLFIQKVSDDPFIQVYAAKIRQMLDENDETFNLDSHQMGPEDVVISKDK